MSPWHRVRAVGKVAVVLAVGLAALTGPPAESSTRAIADLLGRAATGWPFSTPAAPAPAPGPALAPAPDPVVVAGDAVRRLTAGVPAGDVSVAAWNPATGRRFAFGARTGIYTASVVKLDILLTLMLQHQDAGTRLTASEVSLATRMMQNSDNDAATSLWQAVGGPEAIETTNRRLGLTATVPQPESRWGLSTTGAEDQLMLLDALVRPGPLQDRGRAFALDLMSHVEPDQAWGVSAGADPHTTTALKNGWYTIEDDGGRWVVNSTGIVTVQGRPVLLAILSRHHRTQDGGIAFVEALARAVAPAVAGPAPATPAPTTPVATVPVPVTPTPVAPVATVPVAPVVAVPVAVGTDGGSRPPP